MQLASQAVDAVATTISQQVNNGALRLMGGTAPKDADDVDLGSASILVEIKLGPQAFTGPSDGVMELLPTDSARAVKGGRITWFCMVDSVGSCVFIGTVGTEDSKDLTLSRRSVMQGDTVAIDTFRYTAPRS